MKNVVILISLLTLFHSEVFSQKNKRSGHPLQTNIKDETRHMHKYEGFYNFYYDDSEGNIYLEIDRLEEELIYVNSLSAGVGSNDIGLDRNQLGNTRVVKFEKYGPKIFLVEPNYNYRAVSQNPDEKKAVEDAFARSVIWGFTVFAEDGDSFLVDATDFFLRDAHGVSERLKNRKQGSYSIDKTRSALFIENTKNFPKNSEFETILTFTGDATGGYIRSVTPSSDIVTVRQHHSFVMLPDNNYKPRPFDPRSGYFGISYYDYATPIHEPIEKRFIARHRLKKKDPSATLSEPVEPIIYYLDRGAPEPIRSALLEGAQWWNQAFESIGYKNAFQVKLLPEGADPLDVRYNVINWVHRSTRGWSYGSTVTDPRTGEIIKGHVLLGSLRVRQDFMIAEGLLAPYETGEEMPKEMQEMSLARLRQLSAHEVGHTIGLAHSYASSAEGRASVMDYPHPVVNIINGKIDLSDAYDDKIGAWDKVAIAYGYQDFPENINENEGLKNIIEEGLQSGLTFLSDQDARPIGGAHPYAHLWDNAADASDELNRVLKVRSMALSNFGKKNIRKNVPYAYLEEVLVPIYFFHRYQTEAAVKLIGGLNYRYALRGDNQPVTEMVPAVIQRKALSALLKTIEPEALMISEDILNIIPPRPIGYRRSQEIINIRTGLTFDALGAAEAAADMTVSMLLHPARAARLVEHHARDKKQPGLDEVLNELIDAVWKQKIRSGVEQEINHVVQNVVLQQLFRLAGDNAAPVQVKAMAHLKIDEVKILIEKQQNSNAEAIQRAQMNFLLKEIQRFSKSPNEFKPIKMLEAPAGSPIGQDIRCN